MDMTDFDHLPIQTTISFGHHDDSTPSFLFKLNVSHLESIDFKALVHRVWYLSPQPLGNTRWLIWCDAALCRTVKFM